MYKKLQEAQAGYEAAMKAVKATEPKTLSVVVKGRLETRRYVQVTFNPDDSMVYVYGVDHQNDRRISLSVEQAKDLFFLLGKLLADDVDVSDKEIEIK